MMETVLALFCVGFLAYSNGANDNFKGVATLFGCGTTEYKKALGWATFTTLLGSIVALVLASELLATFSGKGLVPDAILQTQAFPIAVAFASAMTVWLATRFGFPISTTHAITGALAGTGFMASEVAFAKLGSNFFLPLAVSPFLALMSAVTLYPILKKLRAVVGVKKETCVCVGTQVVATLPGTVPAKNALAAVATEFPTITVGDGATCRQQYTGAVVGISANKILDLGHYLSAGAVCFSRAVNDTPKIAAILLVSHSLTPSLSLMMVALLMTLGGMLSARKVAETMSHRITEMNSGQGFTANLITSFIVIFASKIGVPVSTTHVSCGALFGIGMVNGHAHWKTIFSIILAWITTLPVAAGLGALSWYAIKGVGL